MSALSLRPFEPSDRAAIESMAAEIVRDGSVFPFESVEGVLAYWFSPGATVVVAEKEGRVLGSYTIKAVQPDRGSHIANAGYMVAEAGRGGGIGRRLGEHSLETARSLGFRAMQFNFVVATNLSAVHLWQSLGFRIVTTIPAGFRHPRGDLVDAHILFREL
jgi:GNAT superfamily N-acetyltransferase